MIRGEIRKNKDEKELLAPSAPEMGEEDISCGGPSGESDDSKEDFSGAFLVGIQDHDTPESAVKEYIAELTELVKTLGIEVKGSITAPLRQTARSPPDRPTRPALPPSRGRDA